MHRLLALLSLAMLCGCGGNSNRVGSYHETTTTIGVSEPYTLPGAKTRCVGSSCGYMPPSSSTARGVDIKPLSPATATAELIDPNTPASHSEDTAPATLVELPPDFAAHGSQEVPVPVSATTTTTVNTTTGPDGTTTTTTKRVIRWPRKL